VWGFGWSDIDEPFGEGTLKDKSSVRKRDVNWGRVQGGVQWGDMYAKLSSNIIRVSEGICWGEEVIGMDDHFESNVTMIHVNHTITLGPSSKERSDE